MLRVLCASFAVFGISAAIAADSKDDLKAMQGTWRPTSGESAGKAMASDVLKKTKLVIKDNKYTVTVGEDPDHGTLKIDASRMPKTMDIVSTGGANKGRRILAIYEIDGDTMKICYDLSGKVRPKEFKTAPGSQLFFATYRLEKE
jgi:uncharacterized protein (TIGR03067 family)